MMKIRKLMVKDVITMPLDASVYEATKTMNKKRIGCVVVAYNGGIVGILTERDLLERVLEECKDPKETKISDVMTRKVIVGDPDMELVEATRLMFDNQVKKLPVVEGNQLLGLVTLTDIARATSVDQDTLELVEKLSNMHRI